MTIKKLHSTLKACKCGFIGTRHQFFYVHIAAMKKLSAYMTDPKEFFADHGEVPLNEDDPRVPQQPIEVTMENSPLPWEA